jgi:peptidoglycan/LPS O-acetylase OafA/YrhL
VSTAETNSAPQVVGGAMFYRPDIDGLRAIAVLGVVAFHSGLPYFPGGFVGVDVFFVISGFLITGLLSAEFERTGSISLRNFFVRRIRRLLPALALVVLVTLCIAMFSMFPRELHRMGNSAQAVALLVANIHFRNFSGGYFDPSTDVMPLLHTWSLAVEEQYYLVWPLLFLLTHRFVRPKSENIHRTTIVTLMLVFVISFAACVWMTGHDRLSAFYLTPYRAWEFALGALLAHAAPLLRARLPALAGDGLVVTGLMAILGMMLFYDDRVAFPGAIALIPVIGSVAVIAGGCASAAVLPSRLLGNRLLSGIGLISYSLYLWHWPLLALARDYSLGSRDLPRDLVIVALSFFLAWLTYRYVENPIRHRKPGAFATPSGSLRIGFLISLFVIATANGIMDWSKRRGAELNKAAMGEVMASNPSVTTNCGQKEDGLTLPPLRDCLLGTKNAPVRLMIWGDSHAGRLDFLFDQSAKNFGFATLMRSLGACPPLMSAVPFKRNEPRFGCGHFNELVTSELPQLTRAGLRGVVLAGRWNAYMALPVTEPGGTYAYALGTNWKTLEHDGNSSLEVGTPPLDSQGAMLTLEDSLHVTLKSLVASGLRVVIVAPVPELYFNGPQCLYRRAPEQCTVLRAKVEARRVLAVTALKQSIQGIDNVRLFDPIDEFCDASLCYTQRNGLTMYGDDNHISPEMAIILGKRMDPLLKWAAGMTDVAE